MDAKELGWWVALRRGEQALLELLDGDPVFGDALTTGTLPPPADESLEADWQKFCHAPNLKELRKLRPASFEYWVAHLSAQVSEMTAPQRKLWVEFLAEEKARESIFCHYGDDFIRKYTRGKDSDHVIAKFKPLTIQAAERWEHKMPWVKRDELKAASKVGLVHAVDRFDPTAGHEFSAFARPVLDTAIQTAGEVTRGGSRDRNLMISEVRKALEQLDLDRQSHTLLIGVIDAVANVTKLPPNKVQDALDAMNIDQPTGESRCGPDGEEISTIDEATANEHQVGLHSRKAKEAIVDALSVGGLTERERLAVMLYYWDGLGDKEIAKGLETTPNDAKQLRHRGIKKVEKWLVARGLNSTRAASAEQPLLGWPCLSSLAGEEYDTARMATVALESLSCLSAVERAVVEGYWQGQTAGQVASVLAVTEPQVGQLRRVALQKLSDWFQQRKGSFPAASPTLIAEGWVAQLDSKFPFKFVPSKLVNFDLVEKIEAWNLARPGRVLLEIIGALGSVPPADRRLLEQYWAGRFEDGPEDPNPATQQNKLQQLTLARTRFAGWLAARLEAQEQAS